LICYSLTYYPQIRAKTGLSPQTPKKWDFTMGPDYLSGRLYDLVCDLYVIVVDLESLAETQVKYKLKDEAQSI